MSHLINRKKRMVFWTLFILLTLLVFEVGSFTIVQLFTDKDSSIFKVNYDDHFFDGVPSATIRQYAQKFYNVDMGWVYPPNSSGKEPKWYWTTDQKGARKNDFASSNHIISVYGDSFAFGDEVNDNQTWSYFLSRLTKTHVDNFGNSGYGQDQAILKLERNRKNGLDRSKIVLLTIHSENINRLMNMYRPFYVPRTKLPLAFKPMYRNIGGEYKLMPNPLQSLHSKQDLYQALHNAEKYDFWYAMNQLKPERKFPYSIAVLKGIYYLIQDGIHRNMFNDPDASGKLLFLLERFITLSKTYHFQPVVIFIPSGGEARGFANSQSKPSYSAFLALINENAHLSRIPVLNLLDDQFSAANLYIKPYAGHLSVYGNQTMAEKVYLFLSQQPQTARLLKDSNPN